MFKKILSFLILFSFFTSEASFIYANEIEKIPPAPLHKKILNIPNMMTTEVFMFFVYICPMLNWITGIALLDEPVTAEKLYYEYKRDEFLEEFKKNAPKIIEDFEREFDRLKFEDLVDLKTNPEDIECRIEYLKLLKDKEIITKDYYFYSKFDDCIGLYGFLNNINKENYDFYLSLLEEDVIKNIFNSEKIAGGSYEVGLLNRINEKNYPCFKTLFEEGFIEENYINFIRDFKNNSDYEFLLNPNDRESYIEYSALFDKNGTLTDYDFKDNYNSFLLLKENGFSNDDIKKVLNHNETDIYCFKNEAVKEVLSNSKIKTVEKITEKIDKNNEKRVKKIKKNIEIMEFYASGISAVFFQPPYIFPAALDAEREVLKFNNYVKQEEKQKKKEKQVGN